MEKVYRIENPSDAYTLASADEKAAQMATLLLGRGAYGLTDEQGATVLPIFLLGGGDAWVKERFGDVTTWIDKHLDDLIAALDGVQIGSFAARKELTDALACMEESKRADYLARRHDRMRSSMNDIGKAAQELAGQLRQRAAKNAAKKVL